jgi:hypothetical protein
VVGLGNSAEIPLGEFSAPKTVLLKHIAAVNPES